MALAKKHRLSKKDIDHLFKRGETVKNSFFFIRFLKNKMDYLRVAVIIPIKVAKKATTRNRTKRIFTEVIHSGHFLEKSYDITIVATVDIVGKQPKKIKRYLEQTLNKLLGQSR